MKRHGTIGFWGIAALFALEACAPSVIIEDSKGDGWMPNPASAGLPNPSSYTVDATNDTVTDNVTGLMWQRTVNDSEFAGSEAKDYCINFVHGGHDDWRLPSRIELVSLVDFTRAEPAIDTNAFSDAPLDWFSTSSPVADVSNQFWWVGFDDGFTNYSHILGSMRRVRCARLGHTDMLEERYRMVNGTVYDTKMKLTWQQTISPYSFAWSEAQNYCSNLNLEGDGWRVPSMKELQTIVDETRSKPAIDVNTFPDTPPEAFWTSTAMAGPPSRFWFVGFYDGFTFHRDEFADTGWVRCVR